MPFISESATLVRNALISKGLETPMKESRVSNKEKRERIKSHMFEILTLLNLDLDDDSLEETPNRIAKMYVDEIFQA